MGSETEAAVEIPLLLHDPLLRTTSAEIVQYRVRTGDTLESLAASLGCTWQEIARLNWGTDDREHVDWYLEHYVGCTERRGDERVFSDTDQPGVIALPRHPVSHAKRIRRDPLRVCRFPLERANGQE